MKTSTFLGLLLLLAVFGGVLVTTPYGFGHPTSDSMEPVMTQDDVFFIVPAGDINTGDVVVFETPATDVLTVHRVVGVTPDGYVTKGDANQQTDQAVGMPVVTRDHIVGEALTYNSNPVTIPKSYRVVSFIQSNAVFVGMLGVLLMLVYFGKERYAGRFNRENPERPIETTDIMTIVPVAAVVVMTAFIFLTPAVYSVSVVATDPGVAEKTTINIPVGQEVDREVEFERVASSPFGTAFPESIGGQIQDTTTHDDQIRVVMRVGPYAQPGHQTVDVLFYRYPSSLPAPWIEFLHSIHPLLAAFITSTIVIGPLGLLFYVLVPNNVPIRVTNIPRSLR